MISFLLGGVGLFLLGMTLMTEGLRAAAGNALRQLVTRFTGGPARAFVSGAALTTLVQSSSATVVMTIGFVSAGLLTVAQAIGVVFGAAVGTTSTSWLVAIFGLRYSVSVVALPLLGIGVLMRLLGRGRVVPIGMFIAGFGLFFVGVDTLQAGMAEASAQVRFATISAASIGGRLLLVAIGLFMTVLMQSSTAAVATTLAALYAGTIGLPQAAALVIGQNVGTTVTAAIASIGASVPARRTALAHILLNSFSGVIAFILFPLYIGAITGANEAGIEATLLIAFFHTAINLVGVGLLLPVTDLYGRFIARLIPDRGPGLTRYLDTTLLTVPTVAVEAAHRTVVGIGAVLVRLARFTLAGRSWSREESALMDIAGQASGQAREFVGRIRTSPEEGHEYRRHLSVLHAVDHLERLLEALRGRPSSSTLAEDDTLREVATVAHDGFDTALNWLEKGDDEPAPSLEELSREIAERRRRHRPVVMARTASGETPPDAGLRTLDAMRWIDRTVYHVWRAIHHLGAGGEEIHEPLGDFDETPLRMDAGALDHPV